MNEKTFDKLLELSNNMIVATTEIRCLKDRLADKDREIARLDLICKALAKGPVNDPLMSGREKLELTDA